MQRFDEADVRDAARAAAAQHQSDRAASQIAR